MPLRLVNDELLMLATVVRLFSALNTEFTLSIATVRFIDTLAGSILSVCELMKPAADATSAAVCT
jgi:hypothetical protein